MTDPAFETTVTSRGFLALGAVFVLGLGGLGVGTMLTSEPWWAGVITLVAAVVGGLLMISIAALVVRVDEHGFSACGRWIPVPWMRVRRADLAGAEVRSERALAWGGWGYRIGPGGRALIVRSGPALVVTTTAGERRAVTLDESEARAAAAALTASGTPAT